MSRRVMCLASEKGIVLANKCVDNGIMINTLKLEQLLILTHGIMLSICQKPLFKEKIIAREHALMIDEVDRDLRSFAIEYDKNIVEYISLLEIEEAIMNYVIVKYGKLNVFELKNIKELKMLKEIYNKEGKATIIENETIEKIFDYYIFLDSKNTHNQKEIFQKKYSKL